jgi:hypothetical protein
MPLCQVWFWPIAFFRFHAMANFYRRVSSATIQCWWFRWRATILIQQKMLRYRLSMLLLLNKLRLISCMTILVILGTMSLLISSLCVIQESLRGHMNRVRRSAGSAISVANHCPNGTTPSPSLMYLVARTCDCTSSSNQSGPLFFVTMQYHLNNASRNKRSNAILWHFRRMKLWC